MRAERERHTVYPPPEEVFAALHLTSYATTRVLILGQDPYHGPRQAHGLCFSVRRGVRIPPSLVNIHKELPRRPRHPPPDHGNLEAWAGAGRAAAQHDADRAGRQSASHQGHGWETFTDEVIRTVAAKAAPRSCSSCGAATPAARRR